MKRPDPELEALLESGRMIRRLPAAVRTRVLARAHASMAARTAFAPVAVPATPTRSRKLRFALAASVCLAAGGAGTAVALLGRTPHRTESATVSRPPAARPVRIAAPDPEPPSSTVAQPISIAKPQRGRPANAQESYAAELKLLKRAQAAYADRDFPGALTLVVEHARRFPKGRLAEEREALRVRSLASAGRAPEARRAAAAFAARFPRSVLLPRLREELRAPE